MQDLPMLPFGVSDFTKIISNNLLYVDKTDLVYKLASQFAPIVLSRPRRFEKSLLVSTFDALFSGQKDLFKGLKIYDLWQDNNKYKVLRLDFSDTSASTYEVFVNKFNQKLEKNFKDLGIKVSKPQTNLPEDYFYSFLCECEDCEVVLLIDEYDAPLTELMNDESEFEKVRERLSNFYKCVKSNEDKIRFVFLTGITRYSQTSIFSAFNNLMDISTSPDYGAIVGYTNEELEHYFKDYLTEAAKKLNLSVDSLKNKLKLHYDGYCFEDTASIHVYNTWSIISFFGNFSEGYTFKPYWSNSGGFSTLVVNYLKDQTHFDNFKEFSLLPLNQLNPKNGASVELDFDSLTRASNPKDMDSRVLMYQAGYLTIKKTQGNIAVFGIPNLEVSKFLSKLFVSSLFSSTLTDKKKYEQSVTQALMLEACSTHSLDAFVKIFETILNSTSYGSKFFEDENTLRDLIYLIFVDKGLNCSVEKYHAKGRCDLCIETDEDRFVFEFKISRDDSGADEKLNEALQQIEDKAYGKILPPKNLYRFTVVFSKDQKAVIKSKSLEPILLNS